MRGVAVNGLALVAARERQGISQAHLAAVARVDAKTVRKAERGHRIDVTPLTRLAYVLNLDLADLIQSGHTNADLHLSRRELILRWNRVWDNADMEGLLALYHEDATLHLPGKPAIPFGGDYHGKAEIRRAHEIVWSSVSSDPHRLDEMTILVSDTGVTIKGDTKIHLPSGETLLLPSLQTFLFVDHLIFDHDVQFDTLDFVQRVALPS